MKKTGLCGTVYYFSADYGAISVDDILSIHKYLIKKMFEFVKQIFILAMMFFSYHFPSVNSLIATPFKCISMTIQGCKVRPHIVDVNSHEPVFYPFSIKTSKCGGNCNNINNRYAKLRVPT